MSADTFGKVLETVHSCATTDSVATAIEQLVRAEVAKGGSTAARAVQTNRLMRESLSKLGGYLMVADWTSYTAELSSSVAIGNVPINVFGVGTPPALGGWGASCSNSGADSTALYKNLAQQDAYFTRQSEELADLPSWRTDAGKAIKPLNKCAAAHNEKVAQDVQSTWADKRAAVVVAELIRALGGASSAADVTAADLQTAMVPADCDNVPAQRLVNGESTGDPGQGWLKDPHVAVDLAGLGYKQQLASYGCTAGGVGWPENLILVGRGGELLASYDLFQIGKQTHAVVKSMTASGKTATVTWDSYDGAGDDVHSYRSKVTYSDGRLVLTTTPD